MPRVNVNGRALYIADTQPTGDTQPTAGGESIGGPVSHGGKKSFLKQLLSSSRSGESSMPEELKAAKAKVWAEQQQFWQQVDRDAQTRFAGMPDGPEKEAAIEAHNTEAMDMFNRAIKPKLWAEYTRKEREVVKRMGLPKAPDSWLGQGI